MGDYNDGKEQQRRFAVLGISSILLVAMVAAVGVTLNCGDKGAEENDDHHLHNAQRNNVDMICNSID